MTAGAIRRLRISRLGFPFVIGTVLFIAALTIAGLVLSLRPQSHGAMLHLHEARVVTAKNRSGLPPLPPYARFLESDFAPFRDGFEWKQVEAAIQQCANVRIAIIGGQLYTQRLSAVWETRDLFLYLGILDMLHHHEAECPDVYFGVFLWDDPATQCQYSPNSAVAPIFAFSSSPSTGAIMIPDWSYWGWPEVFVQPWGQERAHISQAAKRHPWEGRSRAAMWRGSTTLHNGANGDRSAGDKRAAIVRCSKKHPKLLNAEAIDWEQGRRDPASLALGWGSHTKACQNRMLIHAQGIGWSASLKYKLACGAAVIWPRTEHDHHDFFSRALKPGQHFLAVEDTDPNRICTSITKVVEDAQRHDQNTRQIAKQGATFAEQHLAMPSVRRYFLEALQQYAELQM